MLFQFTSFLAGPKSHTAHLLDSEEFLARVSGTHVAHQQGTTSEQRQPTFQTPDLSRQACLTPVSLKLKAKALSQISWSVMGKRTKGSSGGLLSSVALVVWAEALSSKLYIRRAFGTRQVF